MPEYLTAAAAAKKYPAWWANVLKAFGQLVIIADPPPVVVPTPVPVPVPVPVPIPVPVPVPVPTSGLSVWTTPVAGLRPGDPRYVTNLVEYGDVFGGTTSRGKQWTSEFGMDPSSDYSVAVYDAKDADGMWPVWKKHTFGGFVQPGVLIPWNKNWVVPTGRDGYASVLDHVTGHEWGVWNGSWFGHESADNDCRECQYEAWVKGNQWAYDPTKMLCAASAFQVRDPQGRPVDTRTWRGNFPGASGGGWPVGRLAVTPDEVLSGRIGHALHMYAANTMKAGGPVTAVAPAGQHELAGQVGTALELARGIPEGTRFSLDMSELEFLFWLDGKGIAEDSALARTMRTIGSALVEYGWFVGDTSPNACTWIFASAANPATKAGWVRCGVPEGAASKGLLAGLPMDRIRVWAPPEQLVAGRWTSGHGWATDARYGGGA